MSNKHPLAAFAFCPRCGSPKFEVNNEKSKHCNTCLFTYYLNPSSAVVAFIENEHGELLVCRRAKEPAKNTLDLPGGFVDMDETAETAITREIEEEPGVKATSIQYLYSKPNKYLYSGFLVPTLDMFFVCTIPEGSAITPADDVSEAFFMSKEELDPNEFGLTSIRLAVEEYKSGISLAKKARSRFGKFWEKFRRKANS